MLKHLCKKLWILFALATTAASSQSFSKFIAPQFKWESQFGTTLPKPPFKSDSITNLSRDEQWALGMFWQKPYEKLSSKNLYVLPLWQQLHFNTVQGWVASLGVFYRVNSQWTIKPIINYGMAEQIARPHLSIWHERNKNHSFFFQIGQKINQFNTSPAIVPRANTISSLLFEENLGKFYEKSHLKGVHVYSKKTNQYSFQLKNSLSLSYNTPLRNNTNQLFFNYTKKEYTSNHPQLANEYQSDPFYSFTQAKYEMGMQFATSNHWGQEINKTNSYLQSTYVGSIASIPLAQQDKKMNSYGFHLLLIAQQKQLITLSDWGELSSFFQAGAFAKEKEIAFIDYKHFNGNQTQVVRGSYLEVFHLLPYYSMSTDKSFAISHIEHNFKGNLLEKIPLIRSFKWEAIFSFKRLVAKDQAPYTELAVGIGNIGFKNDKIFRLDYVQSYHNNQYSKGFLIGLVF